MKGLALFLFALSVKAQCRRQNACRPDGGVVAPGQNCRPNTDVSSKREHNVLLQTNHGNSIAI
jgi:hypothetical protein